MQHLMYCIQRHEVAWWRTMHQDLSSKACHAIISLTRNVLVVPVIQYRHQVLPHA